MSAGSTATGLWTWSGCARAALGWPSFWWLEYYAGFHENLRSRFPCLPRAERVVAFDLRGRG